MYQISNQHRDTIIALLGELERLPGRDIRTTNVKRVARIIIKKLKNKEKWEQKRKSARSAERENL